MVLSGLLTFTLPDRKERFRPNRKVRGIASTVGMDCPGIYLLSRFVYTKSDLPIPSINHSPVVRGNSCIPNKKGVCKQDLVLVVLVGV